MKKAAQMHRYDRNVMKCLQKKVIEQKATERKAEKENKVLLQKAKQEKINIAKNHKYDHMAKVCERKLPQWKTFLAHDLNVDAK